MDFNQSASFNTVLPTALLKHTLEKTSHYDWLVGNPHDPDGHLWTARIALESRLWAGAGECRMTVIAPHRRKYLSYEGVVSNHRGFVERVDQGQVVCRMWSQSNIVLDVKMLHFTGQAQLQCVSGHNWQATFT